MPVYLDTYFCVSFVTYALGDTWHPNTRRDTHKHTQFAREHTCDLRKNYLLFLFVSWVHVWAVSVDFALVDSFPIPVPKN